MKLDKFNKNKKYKNIFLSLGFFVLVFGGGFLLYRSYANYEENKSYNVLKGQVGNFIKSDVNIIAMFLDGIQVNEVPERKEYDRIEVDCGENATGEWDTERWGLFVSNINQTKVKCSINFVSKTYHYGIRRLLTTSDSSWERIEDSVGLVANAQVGTTEVKNDFDSIYPWSDIISYNYDVEEQKVTAYYGEEGFTFDGSNGEVLTKIPEFYYKRVQDSEYEYIYISNKTGEGYTKSEEFSVGRYTMSGDSTRVHSRSGYTPLTKVNITNFRTYARNLGSGFEQMDWHYFLLQMLYLVEYADYNSQAKIGPGYANGSLVKSHNSGGCDFLGMKSGSVDGTNNSSIIYRGIEDIFGNVWQFIDGINIQNNQAYICYDSSQYEVNKFDGCYKAIGYVNANTNGYITKLGYDPENPLVAFPTEVGGSSTTYMSDHFYRDSDLAGAFVGGCMSDWPESSARGLWFWYFHDLSSFKNERLGARLLKTS